MLNFVPIIRNYYIIYAYEKEYFTRITDALYMH